MDNTYLLKSLQIREAELTKENKLLIFQRDGLSAKIQRNNKQLQDIAKKIKDINDGDRPPVITEHALLRYLERVKGIDIKEIKKEILPEDIADIIGKLGSGKFIVNKKFKLIVKNKVIKSIIDV